MRVRPVVWSVLGPGAFALAATIGGRIEPGYRPRDELISALAARGSRAAGVMVPGLTDDLHANVSAATFALWITIPLVAARRATNAPSFYRR